MDFGTVPGVVMSHDPDGAITRLTTNKIWRPAKNWIGVFVNLESFHRSFGSWIRVVSSFVWHVTVSRSVRFGHGTLLVLVLPLIVGCQSMQRRTSQQSAKCGALCARAREAREQGNMDQADRYINEALREMPNDRETRRQLAETMWKTGRRAEAVEEFIALHEQQPKDAALTARLALMQWETNRRQEAAEMAMSALKLDPHSKDAWLIRARHEVSQGQFDEALNSYIQLSQLAPDDLIPMVELAELHLRRGYPERACPLFKTALQHPQTTAEQHSTIEWSLGIAYARSHRWALAVSALDRAIGRREASAEDLCLLGWARMQSGDLAGAQSELRKAFECDPKSSAARTLADQLDASLDSVATKNAITPVGHLE